MADVQKFQGRVLAIDHKTLVLRTESQQMTLPLQQASWAKVGDLVCWEQGQVQVLTVSRRLGSWFKRTLDPRRLKALEVREQVECFIRSFFKQRGFREVRTPLLVEHPGLDLHVHPFRLKGKQPLYLPTSPEFSMKCLLTGGLEKIFQLGPAFRDESSSCLHRSEFTLLEWYRAYAGEEEVMSDVESLFEFLTYSLFKKAEIEYHGKKISFQTPWPRLTVKDLFLEHLNLDLSREKTSEQLLRHCRRLGLNASSQESWDDLFFRLWLNFIEPRLPQNQALFVTRYPESQAALAVLEPDQEGFLWAKRFEVYAGSFELGNAFEELTDAQEQRRRFERDLQLRKELYPETCPLDALPEFFLRALEEGMPPSSGIAMGVDRMVMLLANESHIDWTFWI